MHADTRRSWSKVDERLYVVVHFMQRGILVSRIVLRKPATRYKHAHTHTHSENTVDL